MNFLPYFLCSLIVASTGIVQLNAMDPSPQYPMLAPYFNLLPCYEKTVTLVCMQEGTKILNVPLSLLADARISGAFADMIAFYGENTDITEFPVYKIDDATLRSIIFLMTYASTGIDDESQVCIRYFQNRLSGYEPKVIKHYQKVANYLQFDLLEQALEPKKPAKKYFMSVPY